ncbi:hypothetical protein [Vibrio sp. WXL103]|uniref:hypothetical protein n=1 Tax=Vibrio sp. WXL103 TaxID=3450710 RepID=UPI003EC60B61
MADKEQEHRPPERIVSTISGYVFDAAVSNSIIRVYEFDGGRIGKLLGETNSSQSGEYHIEIVSGSMPIYIEARGGMYVDPYTEFQVTENPRGPIKLASYLNLEEGTDHKLMITPLSNAAAGLIEHDIGQWGATNVAKTIDDTHFAFNDDYGLDVFQTRPLDLKNEGTSAVTTEEHLFGALLMAYSSFSWEHIEQESRRRGIAGFTGGESIYTSYNLADIQYRDLASSGFMNGVERIGDSQITQRLSFGLTLVDVDLYTYELARHILRVVYDEEINRTGTNPREYHDLAERLAGRSGGIFAGRPIKPINDYPPEAKRIGDNILVDVDELVVNVSDFYGIETLAAQVWTLATGSETWVEKWECTGLGLDVDSSRYSANGDDGCHQTNTDLYKGIRDVDLVFEINTLALEDVEKVKLVLEATDLLGYSTAQTEHHEIEFLWDNDAIIVELDPEMSPHRFNPLEGEDYVLKGTITRGLSPLTYTGFQIGLEPGLPTTSFSCIFPEPEDRVCDFKESLEPELLSEDHSPIVFMVTANDDEVRHIHHIYKDTRAPAVEGFFPGGPMWFIKHDAPREHLESYTIDTFDNIDQPGQELYIKLDRIISTAGIRAYLPEYDFRDANQSSLDELHIPSIRFTIADFAESGEMPTSADELLFEVNWHARSTVSGTFYESTISSVAADYEDPSTLPLIPFESYRKIGDYLHEMTYVVPLSADIFGLQMQHVDKDFIQTLTVTVTDEAGNSEQFVTRFRSTKNDPHINVYTPFDDALVTLYRFTQDGRHYPIGTCVTDKVADPDLAWEDQKDLSTCTVLSTATDQPLRVVVDDAAELSKYQWGEPEPMDTRLETSMAFSEVFLLDDETVEHDIHLTEMAVYKSGFFDHLLENDPEPDINSIKQHIIDVDKLFDEPKGFFHFVPAQTRYATNLELATGATPESHYQHRFLAESMLIMASDDFNGEVNSVELAKAFYEDFRSGTLDGKDSDGQPIYAGSIALHPRHYRDSLAKAYIKAVEQYASDNDDADFTWADAYWFANHNIAYALPEFKGEPLFDEQGESPDIHPPRVEVTPKELDINSRVLEHQGSTYMRGSVQITTEAYDPSGIEGDARFKRCITPRPPLLMLFASCEEYKPDGQDIVPSPGNLPHRKAYSFDFHSAHLGSADDVYQYLDMDIFVSDTVGNDWGDEGYQKRLIIDNDAPIYSYHPPHDLTPDELDKVYYNLNQPLLFEFSVTDLIGEEDTSREITLLDDDNQVVANYPYDQLLNGNLMLCAATNEGCEANEQLHPIDSGKWSLKIDGEDLLGNHTLEQESLFQYALMVDSIAPVVPEDEIGMQGIVGSVYEWDVGPTVDYGPEYSSEPGLFDVFLYYPDSSSIKLERCDNLARGVACDEQYDAYLVGESNDTQVVIVSDRLENEGVYQLRVHAFDTAIPEPNEGVAEFDITIDNVGPIVHFAEQPIDNDPEASSPGQIGTFDQPEHVVVGRRFSVMLDGIEDVSEVIGVSVLQKLDGEEIELLEFEPEHTDEQRIILTEVHTDRIDGADEPGAGDIQLFLRAVDYWQNSRDTDLLDVRFVNSLPVIEISEFDADNPGFYTSRYHFDVQATNDRENVDPERILFSYLSNPDLDQDSDWNELVGGQIPVSEQADYVLSVKATDSVGNRGLATFDIQVDNAPPFVNQEFFISELRVEGDEHTIDWRSQDKDPNLETLLQYQVNQADIGRIESVVGHYTGEEVYDELEFERFYDHDEQQEFWQADITAITKGPGNAYGHYDFSITVTKDTYNDGEETTHIDNREFEVEVDLDRTAPVVTFGDIVNLPEFEFPTGAISQLRGNNTAVGHVFEMHIADIDDDSRVALIEVKQMVNGQEGPRLKVISRDDEDDDLAGQVEKITLSRDHTQNIDVAHGDEIQLYLYLEDEHGFGGDSDTLTIEYVWQQPVVKFMPDFERFYTSNYQFEVHAFGGTAPDAEEIDIIEFTRDGDDNGWEQVINNRFIVGERDTDVALNFRATNRVGGRGESDQFTIKIDNQPPVYGVQINNEAIVGEPDNHHSLNWDDFDSYDNTDTALTVHIEEGDRERVVAVRGICEGERCPTELEFVQGDENDDVWLADITQVTKGDDQSQDGRGTFSFKLEIEKDTLVGEGEEIHIGKYPFTLDIDLDRTAPEIEFADTQVSNPGDNDDKNNTRQHRDLQNAVGEVFDINIKSITDASKVELLEVFEVTDGMRVSIKTLSGDDLRDRTEINLGSDDTSKLSQRGAHLDLVVYAQDEHENGEDSDSIRIYYDNLEPYVYLENFNPDEYYSSGFELIVVATNGDGDNSDPLTDLYFKRSEEDDYSKLDGNIIEVELDEDYTLWVMASNGVTETESQFDIQVDNSSPEVSININNGSVIEEDQTYAINWDNHNDEQDTILRVRVTSTGDAERVDQVTYCTGQCFEPVEMQQDHIDSALWLADITEITLGDEQNPDGMGMHTFDVMVSKPINNAGEDSHIGVTERGFNVQVDIDRTGPMIMFADVPVVNAPEEKSVTVQDGTKVGREFDIQFNTFWDRSNITEVIVYQQLGSDGNDETLSLVKHLAIEQGPYNDLPAISLLEADTDNLMVSADNAVKLVIHAIDEHDNLGTSEQIEVEFIHSKPVVEIVEHATNLYYTGDYPFTVRATNGIDGPDVEELEWRVGETGDWNTMQGNTFVLNEQTGDHQVSVRATNIVGAHTTETFLIRVDNEPAEYWFKVNNDLVEDNQTHVIDWEKYDEYDNTDTYLKVYIGDRDSASESNDAIRVNKVTGTCDIDRCPDPFEFVPAGAGRTEYWLADITAITQGDDENPDGQGSFEFEITVEKDTLSPNEDGDHVANSGFTVKVDLDRSAPEITFNQDPIENQPDSDNRQRGDNNGYPVSSAFDIKIDDIADASEVVKLKVFELGQDEPIKVIEAASGDDLRGQRVIKLSAEHTDNLSGPGTLELVVYAEDIHNNGQNSAPLSIYFDSAEPVISLPNYNASDFYSSGYELIVEATNGVDGEPLKGIKFKRLGFDPTYQVLKGDKIQVLLEQSYDLAIQVNNGVTEVERIFTIQVDNDAPVIDVTINDSEVIGDNTIFDITWDNHDDELATILQVEVTSAGDDQRVDQVSYCIDGCGQREEMIQDQDNPELWTADISAITQGGTDDPDVEADFDFKLRISKPIQTPDGDEDMGLTESSFKVRVDLDRTAPVVELDNPPVENVPQEKLASLQGDNVVGREFNIKLVTLEDRSEIEFVEVIQPGNLNIIKRLEGGDFRDLKLIPLQESETQYIQVDENNLATLAVVATDEHGNRSEPAEFEIEFIYKKPVITIEGYQPDNHYVRDFVFTIVANNGDEQGPEVEDLEWRYTGDSEWIQLESDEFQVDEESGQYEVEIRAINKVGGHTTESFTINIDNEAPEFVLLINDVNVDETTTLDWSNYDDYDNTATWLKVDIDQEDEHRVVSVTGTCIGERCPDLEFTPAGTDRSQFWLADITAVTLGDQDNPDGEGEFEFHIRVEKDTIAQEADGEHIGLDSFDLSVDLDRTAPVVTFSDDVVTNQPDEVVDPYVKGGDKPANAVGQAFDINVDNIYDKSDVVTLRVVEVVGEAYNVIKEISDEGDLSGREMIELRKTETDRLSGQGDVTLAVYALDEHGNDGYSEPIEIYFDNAKPQIELVGYDQNAYYSSGFEFEVEATNGVDGESLPEVYFKRGESGSYGLVQESEVTVEKDEDYTLWLKASNGVRETELQFPIKVDNSDPQVMIKINESDDIGMDDEYQLNWDNYPGEDNLLLQVIVESQDDIDRIEQVSYRMSDCIVEHSNWRINGCDMDVSLEQDPDNHDIWTANISHIMQGDIDNPSVNHTFRFDVRVSKSINTPDWDDSTGVTTRGFYIEVDLDRKVPFIVLAEPPVSAPSDEVVVATRQGDD